MRQTRPKKLNFSVTFKKKEKPLMFKSKIRNTFHLSALLFLLAHCGSGIDVAPGNSLPNNSPPNGTPAVNPSSPQAPQFTQTTARAFNIGSSFPTDIDIVDQPGIKNIAFITTTSSPAVEAVDLDTNPLSLSTTVKGLSGAVSGFANNLFVVDAAHAFLLTSMAVIYFNPTDGTTYQTVGLTQAITTTAPLQEVDGSGKVMPDIPPGSFTPSLPASMVFAGNKLAVSFSNLYYDSFFNIDHAVQGVVLWFSINPTPPYLTPASVSYSATSGYNLTGLTLLPNGNVLATNTGITKFTSNGSVPVTAGSVDLLAFSNGQVLGTLDLGMTAPAFRSWAVTPDGSQAFLGSSSGGYVLQIGLNPLSVIRGEGNPIVITTQANGTDFIDDVVMYRLGGGIFPMSFNSSKVFGIDLTVTPPILIGDSVDLTDPSTDLTMGVTGAGPGALRPGVPGVDFNGPDLFILTSNPGTMAAIKTY
jgi:hypothetical protein